MLELGPDDVHLWMAFPHTDVHRERRDLYARWLSRDERERESRFPFEKDRHRFRVTRAMVRRVLAEYLGVEPTDCVFETEAHGRPRLATHDASPDAAPLSFNLSHADDLILLGVTRARAIGVDVERLRGKTNTARLAARFFAPYEHEAVAREPEATRENLFLRFWTLKEAYIKARGIGLALPLGKFGFVLGAPCPELRVEPSLGDDPARWAVHQWQPTPAHWAAICLERPAQPPAPASVRDFAQLVLAQTSEPA